MTTETVGRAVLHFEAETTAAVAGVEKLRAAVQAQAAATEKANTEQQRMTAALRTAQEASQDAAVAARRATEAQAAYAHAVKVEGEQSEAARRAAVRLTDARKAAHVVQVAAARAVNTATVQLAKMSAGEEKVSDRTRRFAQALGRLADDAERTGGKLTLTERAAGELAKKLDDEAKKSHAAARATSELGGEVDRLKGRYGGLGRALETAGGSLIASAVTKSLELTKNALTGVVGAGVNFESKMADVAKVVDGLKSPTGQTTEAYAALEQELFRLSETIAISPEGLAELAAQAGMAGIAGAELTAVVEDSAKAAVAFNMSAEEAGAGLIKLRTGLGLTQQGTRELAGQINYLSNNFAAQAPELIDAVQRVGAVGKAAGITGAEIAALSTVMIASGASAEQAGTGTKNFIIALEQGTGATKAQQEAFKALGLDAEAVGKALTSGDIATRTAQIAEVLERISGVADAQRVPVLTALFGRESLGTIGPLATSLDLYNDAMTKVMDTTRTATSVQSEFESRSATTENTLELLQNAAKVTAITIGGQLLPEVNSIAKEVTQWVGNNRELIATEVTKYLHEVIGVMKAGLPIIGGIASTTRTVIEAFGGAERATGPLIAGLVALRTASTLALGPWGLLAAGIVAGAVAIRQEMAAAEKQTMNMIRAADRLRKERMNEGTVGSKSVTELEAESAALAKQLRDNRVIQRDMRGRSPAAIARENAERKADVESLTKRKQLIDATLATQRKQADVEWASRHQAAETERIERGRLATLRERGVELQKQKKKTDADKRELQAIANSLRAGGAADAGDFDVAVKPRGSGKKGKTEAEKEAERLKKLREQEFDFEAEMAVHAAREAKKVRDEAARAQADAWTKNGELFAEKELQFDREMEILELQGFAEEELQMQREAILQRRMEAEEGFAERMQELAVTAEQREAAQTRAESVAHQQRVAALKKAAAEQAAVYKRNAEIVGHVTSTINDLGRTMVDAAWEAAEGQRGAMLSALGDYLKMVSRQMTVKALVEVALGVSALAGIVTAAKAPGHFAAAGVAAAAAVAAGGAGIALSGAGEARAAASAPVDTAGAGTGGTGAAPPSDSGGTATQQPTAAPELRELPISYAAPVTPAAQSTTTVYEIDLSGGTWIGTGSPERAGQELQKILRQASAAGSR